MKSTLVLLLLCVVGAWSEEQRQIGKLPQLVRTKNAKPSLDIINGNKTSIAKHPYIASVLIDGNEYGAGVVLTKRWLLTTAWNVAWVSSDQLSFRVGSNSYSQKGQTLNASKVVVHENYTGSWDWDIAVVKTDKPIKLNKKVKTISLGTTKLTGGTKANVAGWGEKDSSEEPSDSLREAEVTVYSWKQCFKVFSSDLTDRLMCTFDKTVGPCIYDFGDPLVYNKLLYGLFAGGYGCTPGDNPVLYTDIPSLYQWVLNNIKGEDDD